MVGQMGALSFKCCIVLICDTCCVKLPEDRDSGSGKSRVQLRFTFFIFHFSFFNLHFSYSCYDYHCYLTYTCTTTNKPPRLSPRRLLVFHRAV